MAIVDLWAFDHLPQISAAIGSAIGPLTLFRPDVLANAGGNAADVFNVDSSGWLNGPMAYNGSSYTMSSWGVPYANVSDFTKPRSWLGLRFRYNNATFTGTGSAGANGNQYIVILKAGSVVQPLVTTAALGLPNNKETYVEVMIDRTAKQIVVWQDGVQKSITSFDFNAWVTTNGSPNIFFGFSLNPGGSFGCSYGSKNHYFVDDTTATGDGLPSYRLGPIKAVPVTLSAATAANWTSSDSQTALTDLNTVMGTTAGTQTAPLLSSPVTYDPVVATLQAGGGLSASQSVIAVKMYASAQRTSGNMFSLKSEYDYNGGVTPGSTLTFQNVSGSLIYNQNAGILQLNAPDGTPLTVGKINQTQLKLTPVNALTA